MLVRFKIFKTNQLDLTNHNKSQVVSCYWFKFEPNTKITFFALIITTSNNLPFRICCKNVVDIPFLIYIYIYIYIERERERERERDGFKLYLV